MIGVGSLLTTLDGFAAAGGTGQAFIIDTTANGLAQFVDAMHSIRAGQGLPCDYSIPTSERGPVDLAMVNLDYRSGYDSNTTIPLWHVDDTTRCSPGQLAWYYDDAKSPRKIRLCDQACSQIKLDVNGEVDVSVGCPTRMQ